MQLFLHLLQFEFVVYQLKQKKKSIYFVFYSIRNKYFKILNNKLILNLYQNKPITTGFDTTPAGLAATTKIIPKNLNYFYFIVMV